MARGIGVCGRDVSLLAGLAWRLGADLHPAWSSWPGLVPAQGGVSENKEALVWSSGVK